MIAIAVMGLWLYQVAVSVGQIMHLIPSNHSFYRFTGSFINPGPAGCYLAIGMPVLLRFLILSNNRLQKWLGMGMALMGAFLIPSSLSRTAMVAAAIGCTVAASDIIVPCVKRAKWAKISIFAAALLLIASGAYQWKKDSADGRLLMWKVAADAAMEAPLTGVGWDKVAGSYGDAQERYFAAGKGSEQEVMVAGAPEYVFNEYLQVAIAFGTPAALWMTALLSGAIAAAVNAKAFGLAGAAVAVAVVMTASYPLQFPLFTVTIGMVFAGCYLSARKGWIRWTGCIGTIASAWFLLANSSVKDVSGEFNAGRSLHRVERYRRSIDCLLAIAPYSSDPMPLNIIGKNYQALGMPDSAAHYFHRAANRCPNRLYPHYLLMQLYADSASYDRDLMLQEARILATKKEKVPSPAVDEMRRKALTILNTHP